MDATHVFPDLAADLPSGKVYRYRPYRIEEMRPLLRAGEIRFSEPRRFNDPWDCRPLFYARPDDLPIRTAIVTVSVSLDPEYAKDIDAERLSAVAAKVSEIVRDPSQFDTWAAKVSDYMQEQLRSRYRLLCLSALPDVPLMWSHYANAHRGVCLVFDAKNPIIGKARRVEYPDHYPAVPDRLAPENFVTNSFLNKAEYWGYEREYRVIACVQPGEHADLVQCDKVSYVHAGVESLMGIIMGCSMSPQDRRETIALREETLRHVDLYEARTRHNDYKLDIVKL